MAGVGVLRGPLHSCDRCIDRRMSKSGLSWPCGPDCLTDFSPWSFSGGGDWFLRGGCRVCVSRASFPETREGLHGHSQATVSHPVASLLLHSSRSHKSTQIRVEGVLSQSSGGLRYYLHVTEMSQG